MSDTHEAVLGKIKALLRLAEDSRARGSLHEAEAAAARAGEMVQRYRLDMASIEASDPAGLVGGGEEIGEVVASKAGRAVPWKAVLLNSLARQNGCTSFCLHHRAVPGERQHSCEDILVGRPSDVEIVRHLYAWLSLVVSKLAEEYVSSSDFWEDNLRRGKLGLRQIEGKPARNAFCLGAAITIGKALERSQKAADGAHAQASGAVAHKAGALVLRQKDVDLGRYMKRKKLRSVRSATYSSSSAFERGQAAGSRVDVSGRRMLGGRS